MSNTQESFSTRQIDNLQKKIMDEVCMALGLQADTKLRMLIKRFVGKQTRRFCEIGAEFDEFTADYGFSTASRKILPEFITSLRSFGADLIPKEQPLVISANHPGTYDSLVVAANILRDDLKILASDIPFIRNLSHTSEYMIFLSKEMNTRISALRKAIRHLKDGGALFLFGSGGIDPEPEFMDGATKELMNWSRSIDFLLTKVPELQLVLSIVSGVISPKYMSHPLTYVRKSRRDRQRISEFLQVINQMFRGKNIDLHPKVSFGFPLSVSDFQDAASRETLHQLIQQNTQSLFEQHLNRPENQWVEVPIGIL